MKRFLSIFTLVAFCFSNLSSSLVFAQTLNLPSPNQILNTSEKYSFPVLSAVKIDPKNPLNITFIIDSANQDNVSQDDAAMLIRYFLAGLTIPQKDLWVNLSPYEQNRIIPQELSETDMGSDMLSQDYFLKQISASLTYPESAIGKKYWQAMNGALPAGRQVGANNHSPATQSFNKIWIMPNDAQVYEHKDTAIIAKASLKVMMEEDYLAMQKNVGARSPRPGQTSKDAIGGQGNPAPTDAFKRQILPIVENEVNTGKNFAQLRQVYRSLVLATWFKKKFQESFYKNYINQKKINGIDINDKSAKDKIYALYCEAFQKGVYNYTKKERVGANNYSPAIKITKRQYFSGGVGCTHIDETETSVPVTADEAEAKMPQRGLLVETAPADPITDLGNVPANTPQELRVAVASHTVPNSGRDAYVDAREKIIEAVTLNSTLAPEVVAKLLLVLTQPTRDIIHFNSTIGTIMHISGDDRQLDEQFINSLAIALNKAGLRPNFYTSAASAIATYGCYHPQSRQKAISTLEAARKKRFKGQEILVRARAITTGLALLNDQITEPQIVIVRGQIQEMLDGKNRELSLDSLLAMLPPSNVRMREAVTKLWTTMTTGKKLPEPPMRVVRVKYDLPKKSGEAPGTTTEAPAVAIAPASPATKSAHLNADQLSAFRKMLRDVAVLRGSDLFISDLIRILPESAQVLKKALAKISDPALYHPDASIGQRQDIAVREIHGILAQQPSALTPDERKVLALLAEQDELRRDHDSWKDSDGNYHDKQVISPDAERDAAHVHIEVINREVGLLVEKIKFGSLLSVETLLATLPENALLMRKAASEIFAVMAKAAKTTGTFNPEIIDDIVEANNLNPDEQVALAVFAKPGQGRGFVTGVLALAVTHAASTVNADSDYDALPVQGRTSLEESGDAISRDIKALDSNDWTVRHHAIARLGSTKDPRAVLALLRVLKYPDKSDREAAASSLGEINDPSAIPALIGVLENDDNVEVRAKAAWSLRGFKDHRVVSALVRALARTEGKEWMVREAAAVALGKTKDADAIAAIIEAFSDDSRYVRSAVVRALGESDDPRALPVLIAALEDTDQDVHSAAVRILSGRKDPHVFPALSKMLKSRYLDLRAMAAESMGITGDPRAVSVLLQALERNNRYLRFVPATYRTMDKVRNTRDLYEVMDDVDRFSRFSEFNEAYKKVRVAIVRALGKINDPRAASGLAKALKDSSDEVRSAAAEAIKELKTKQQELVDAALADWEKSLRQYLHDKHPTVSVTDDLIKTLKKVHLMPGAWREIYIDGYEEVEASGGASAYTRLARQRNSATGKIEYIPIKVMRVSGVSLSEGSTVIVRDGSGKYRRATLHRMHTAKLGVTLGTPEQNNDKKSVALTGGVPEALYDDLASVGLEGEKSEDGAGFVDNPLPTGGIDVRDIKVGVSANSIPIEFPGVGPQFFQHYSLKIVKMEKFGK